MSSDTNYSPSPTGTNEISTGIYCYRRNLDWYQLTYKEYQMLQIFIGEIWTGTNYSLLLGINFYRSNFDRHMRVSMKFQLAPMGTRGI